MSFRDILEAGQALALADKLHPTEEAIWAHYCREFSTRFHTPLLEVRNYNPLFVIQEVNGDNLSDFNPEEQIESLMEMIGTLSDREYDIKKERAIREEMRQIEEREKLRIERGEAIHSSLEKDKRIIAKEQPPVPKELPKSGGVNMALINQLNSSDKES